MQKIVKLKRMGWPGIVAVPTSMMSVNCIQLWPDIPIWCTISGFVQKNPSGVYPFYG